MKTSSWITSLHFSTTLALAWACPAFAGNESGHGGDAIAARFTDIGYRTLGYLNDSPENKNLLTSKQSKAIKNAVILTPVHAVDAFDLPPYHVDAQTVDDAKSPTGKAIKLLRRRWERLLTTNISLEKLVFHEYLWVIGANDERYRISSQLHAPPTRLASPTYVSIASCRAKDESPNEKGVEIMHIMAGVKNDAKEGLLTLELRAEHGQVLTSMHVYITERPDGFLFSGFSDGTRFGFTWPKSDDIKDPQEIKWRTFHEDGTEQESIYICKPIFKL